MNTIHPSGLDFSLKEVRSQFPILQQEINGYPLVYLDNAATSQKPKAVIDSIVDYYSNYNSNIHRGIHSLAEKATKEYESSREAVRKFINAGEKEEIIFTKGTTESINLVSRCIEGYLKPGDEIIISGLEHHSNLVPWQYLAERTGSKIRIIPFSDAGELNMKEYRELLSNKTKVVCFNHASNALGTINPVKELIDLAKEKGAWTMVDGAQACAHLDIDVQDLDADFYAFSAHKMYGPTGVGVLYGKRDLLEQLPPYQLGGEMIRSVSYEKTTYNDLPYKFEAGTPNIAGVIALHAAIEFIEDLGKVHIRNWENELLAYGTECLSQINGLRIYGTAKEKVSVLSFLVEGVHPFDMGQMLDARGIAVRTGHHCTEPIMNKYGIDGTVRASFAVYNTLEEIDLLRENLERITKYLK